MTAIPIDDYFASVEARFESPSPYGRKEITVEAPKHVCECGKAFDTEQGLRVHKGRAHSNKARKPAANHPWRSPAVMPPTAPEEEVEHCDHVERCGITGITECGADPCELVASWRDERCGHRIHLAVVAPLRDLARDGSTLRVTPDYRMELIETLAELATWEATLADPDPVQATLARIKAVARNV